MEVVGGVHNDFILGGPWDFVCKAIRTSIGAISCSLYIYLTYNPGSSG